MKYKHNIDLSIIVMALAMFALLALTSCATNGYGCKGRGKLITRVPQ